jgi:hypothetical protein
MLTLGEDKMMYWNGLCITKMNSIAESNNNIVITKPDLSVENINLEGLHEDVIAILRSFVQQYIDLPESFGVGS